MILEETNKVRNYLKRKDMIDCSSEAVLKGSGSRDSTQDFS